MTHLAGVDQLADGRPAFLDLLVRLGPVDLVEIDRLDLQAAQAGVALGEHALAPQRLADLAAVAFPHAAALGGDDHVVAAPGDRLPDQLLGVAVPVDRGGVDPVDAGVEAGLDGAHRLGVVLRAPAELPVAATHRPGAETDGGEVETARAEGPLPYGDGHAQGVGGGVSVSRS